MPHEDGRTAGPPPRTVAVLDAAAVHTWCGLALEALGRAREEIDAINVYPVADGDTGTNLYLTMESAAGAVDAVFTGLDPDPPSLAEAVRAMAHGALIGARGNSGTILAQLLRGMAEVLSGPETGVTEADGAALRRALRRAVESAYEAVARPVEGTVLTVATAAAETAAADDCAAVARGAYERARTALEATPRQLAALDQAGVVDAGGQGLVTVLAALVETFTGESLNSRDPGAGRPRGRVRRRRYEEHGRSGSGTVAGADTAAGEDRARLRDGSDGTAAGRARTEEPAEHRAGAPHADGATGEDAADAARHRSGPLPRCAEQRSRHGGSVPSSADGARTTADPAAMAGSGPAFAHGPAAAGSTARPSDDAFADPSSNDPPAFEVIYLLEAEDQAVERLRTRLGALGDSLVVVGGDGLWNVHVHVNDAGAAVEAGLEAGRPHRIRITHFGAASGVTHPARHTAPTSEPAARAIVAVVPGEGLAALYAEAGATTVLARPGEPPASGELVEAIHRAHAREVVLLPNDARLRHTAAAATEQVRADGVRVALIPTRSAVQGIAALAVHEPERRFDEDVVAMTSAAGSTRYAELTVAERQSWTTAGVCQAGDVLGLIDGDVAVIGTDAGTTAASVLDRMLAAGGEMVTLVLSHAVQESIAERLREHVRESYLVVDTVVYQGGRQSALMLIGVE